MKKDKKSQPLPETLKISVRNFGPIGEAKDIALRPLTIFVGPSNTGKSYMAVLAYSLLRVISEMFSSERIFFSISRNWHPSQRDEFLPGWRKIAAALSRSNLASKKTHEAIKLPPEVLAFVRQMAGARLRDLAAEWSKEIERSMGAAWNDISLKKGNAANTHMDLKVGHERQQISWHLTKEMIPTVNTDSLLINDTNILASIAFRRSISEIPSVENEDADDTMRRRRYWLSRSFRYFESWVANQLFSDDEITAPFYLPAARTGIMQSHQAIAAALVRSSSLAAVKPISIPALSGVLADFLEKLILMNTREETNLKSVADNLDKGVIGGSIAIERPTQGYPHFYYAQNGVKIPLLRASSMVTELAPISLFLRHYVEKGNTIIIEEPESHLHPEAQRGIARAIVQLVRAGARVIITTHSDYVLEQISNHVRISSFSDADRKKFVGDSNLYLDPKEVGAYLFAKSKRKGQGTKVRELLFDPEAGFAPADHDVVSSALYNETVAIIRKTITQ